MITVFLRTIIIYFFLILFMKLMGKRQVGELEISELVSALLLSELAAIPIENSDIPLSNAFIPLLTIISLEIILSFLVTKCEKIKRFLGGKPSVLILRGKINKSELSKVRMSIEELFSELRLNGIAELSDVNYAMLEQNGQLSVIQKENNGQDERGISHLLIVDGEIKEANLITSGHDLKWLYSQLSEHKLHTKDILIMTVNDKAQTDIILKDRGK